MSLAHQHLTRQYLAGWLASRARADRGASLVEYALLVALIAVVCIVAITFLGEGVSDNLSQTASTLG